MKKRRAQWILLMVAMLLSIALLAPIWLDRPPGFALNQAANHYYRKGEGLPQQLAGWLIDNAFADNWARPQPDVPRSVRRNILHTSANSTLSYPYQTYSEGVIPRGLKPGAFHPPAGVRYVTVSSVPGLGVAIRNAVPGDIITLAPGQYDIAAQSIAVTTAGQPQLPIYLRAERFGTVLLEMNSLEGFHVMAPYWVFENLRIHGACPSDSRCEHAFHVVGKGHSFTLRNSEVTDFNAPVKVNFKPGKQENFYPDYGLIEYSHFYNNRPRRTGNPVTLLNINSADSWVVRGNYIADFAKSGSDHISYGAFIKGNSQLGLFERNLVMCEHGLPADEGIRVGLSFGGGGSATGICKQRDCSTEHTGGIIRNNIILNCSRDVGIYLNRAAATRIYHNLLYNNLGIDVRFPTSSARISNNIISGRVKSRDGGGVEASGNLIVRNCIGPSLASCDLTSLYSAAAVGDLRLRRVDHRLLKPIPETLSVGEDFCGSTAMGDVNIGPIQYQYGIPCLDGAAAAIHDNTNSATANNAPAATDN